MKRYVLIPVIVAVVFVIVAACNRLEDGLTPFTPRSAEELFTGKSTVGVFDGGIRVWEFDQTAHQQILTRNLSEEKELLRFTIQADDLSRILSVIFPQPYSDDATVLTPVGSTVEIEVRAKDLDKVTDGSKRVKVVRLQNDNNRKSIWLWDADEQLGYLLLTEL